MKKYIICGVLAFILTIQFSNGQGLYNYGAKIIVQNNANIVLNGNYTNMSQSSNNGEIELNGRIFIEGDFVNNATSGGVFINSNSDGNVVFNGVGNSNISGTCVDAILFENIIVESSATITNNHLSSIKGDLTLVGINKTITVGSEDLLVEGQIIGDNHSIISISSGYLSQNAIMNVQKVYPVTDGTNNYRVTITPTSESTSGALGVKLNSTEYDEALTSPMMFFDISGNSDLDATVTLRIDKSAISPATMQANTIMRFWNGTRYQPIPNERVSVVDNGDHYIITITEMNYFNQAQR
jgi:hypothetical protein